VRDEDCMAESSRIVFTQDVNDSLRELFSGTKTLETNGSKEVKTDKVVKIERVDAEEPKPEFKASGFKSSFKPITALSADDDLDGDAMDEGLDGEAMGENLDGEAMDKDLDGMEMEVDENLDGEAIS